MSWVSNVLNDIGAWFEGLPAEGKALLQYLEPTLKSDETALLNQAIAVVEPLIAQAQSGGVAGFASALEGASAALSAGIPALAGTALQEIEELAVMAGGFVMAKIKATPVAASTAQSAPQPAPPPPAAVGTAP